MKETAEQKLERQMRERQEEWLREMNTVVGHTIVGIEEIAGPGDWGEHESYELTLDDGRRVIFSGWGHDAWGCDMTIL